MLALPVGSWMGINPVATAAVTWGDLNHDGRWDFVKAGPASLDVFRQVAVDSFAADSSVLPTTMPQNNVRAVRMADLDRDNDLDLLVIRMWQNEGVNFNDLVAAKSYICYNNRWYIPDCANFVRH